jgi:hypothetical protein
VIDAKIRVISALRTAGVDVLRALALAARIEPWQIRTYRLFRFFSREIFAHRVGSSTGTILIPSA